MGLVKDIAFAKLLGGGGGIELLYDFDVEASTTDTSTKTIYTSDKTDVFETQDKCFIFVISDKAGPREGYAFGCVAVVVNDKVGSTTSGAVGSLRRYIYCSSDGALKGGTGSYGVAVGDCSHWSDGSDSFTIVTRYNSSYGTIDGTFNVKVYAVPFA